jgi:hypothetical protein
VLEQFQFKAYQCSHSYSISNGYNDEVMLHNHFFDGFKMTLCGIKEQKYRMTMFTFLYLPKVILIPTEIEHFEW